MDFIDIGNVDEVIVGIEEVFGDNKKYPRYEGYKVITNKQEIYLLIDGEQGCCEDAGYFMSEDDFNRYIGSRLKGIKITDTALNTHLYNEYIEYGLDGGDVMFVDLTTTAGVLQFTAYNSHNGYYGHEAIVVSKQLKYEVTL